MSLNSVTLLGRLTKEPELRTTQSGVSVASFTLAVDRDFQKGEVDFVDCVAWRNTGEFVSKYFHKGQMMALHGSLQSRTWEAKDGTKRTSWEVVADSVYFGGDKKQEQYAGKNVSAFEDLDDDEGQLPF